MAITRQPGDNAVKTRSRSGTFALKATPFNKPNGPLSPFMAKTASGTVEKDIRPTYAYGRVIELPNGKTFRKATTYSRESWVVGEASPLPMCSGWNPYTRRAYEGTDTGVDVAAFLSSSPKLVGNTAPPGAWNEAVTKALNQIADSKANMGENLATFGQTVRLFTGKGQAVVALANAFKRRENGALIRFWNKSQRDLAREGISNRLSRLYLEYVYGFRPLLSDMYGLHEFSKQNETTDMLMFGRGKASRTETMEASGFSNLSYSRQRRVNWSAKTDVKCHLWARLDPEWGGIRAWNQLGLANPLALAWELVPFSFIVDWMLPIGPVLNALSAPAGLRFVDGSISTRTSEEHSIEYWMDRSNVGVGKTPVNQPGLFPVTYEGYRRQSLGTWPRPGLWIDQDPLRGDRTFKALALAILTLGDKKIPRYIQV